MTFWRKPFEEPDGRLKRQPGEEHSITSQEIYHAVLHKHLSRQAVNLRPKVEI